LTFANTFDSLRRDTLLRVGSIGTVTGKVNHFDLAILEANVYLLNTTNPALNVTIPLDPDGAFTIPAANLIVPGVGLVSIKALVRVKHHAYRPSPDTLRLILDTRPTLPWSLDLDLAGGAAFLGLDRDTLAVSAMRGNIIGRVHGYALSTHVDSIYFRNVYYPTFMATVPLSTGGEFSFNAFDIVGELDGLHPLQIFLKSKSPDKRLTPDTLRINLSIP
jgi:hypothetical protein